MSYSKNMIAHVGHTNDFNHGREIYPSTLSQHQTLIAVLLTIISFVSLSSALLNRKSSTRFISSASVASVSIALASIYACNVFGVYI